MTGILSLVSQIEGRVLQFIAQAREKDILLCVSQTLIKYMKKRVQSWFRFSKQVFC